VWVVRIFGAVNAEAPEMGGFFFSGGSHGGLPF
jgi:hypothetical protein